MRHIHFLPALAAICLSGCSSTPPEPPAQQELQPNVTIRAFNVLRGSPERINKAGVPRTRDLKIDLVIEPEAVRLSADREIGVRLTLNNLAKKQSVNLLFETSQRIEILLKDASGNVLDRWSDDRKFTQDTGFLVVNHGEKAEYAERISTRSLRAGVTYTVEASFVGYPELNASRQIIPAP